MSASKVETNKQQKMSALFSTAFSLFTDKGFAKTTISDIVEQAGLAKGTFYLYFKDKYDLRDKLIVRKAGQLFSEAYAQLMEKQTEGQYQSFESGIFYILDFIIRKFEDDHTLLQFISKNLSWGVFRSASVSLHTAEHEPVDFIQFITDSMKANHITCSNPEIMLFTIVELVSAACYSCILYAQPVSMEEYLPHLHDSIGLILHHYTDIP